VGNCGGSVGWIEGTTGGGVGGNLRKSIAICNWKSQKLVGGNLNEKPEMGEVKRL